MGVALYMRDNYVYRAFHASARNSRSTLNKSFTILLRANYYE